jgi:hypothetical protein
MQKLFALGNSEEAAPAECRIQAVNTVFSRLKKEG